MVAEVTGRSRRVVRKGDRLMVENRAGSANLGETSAFMDDVKRILVFSDAGGTGRSYHAELSARNRRLRVHYLLEPGWKADAAIQGLGRTNRTNQAQPPLFRPIATDVKAEKRFLSTIARRLDTLGAITRGQRQTGGQGLFRPEDNLESHYGRDALRQLYMLLVRGKVEGCSLQTFEDATGLKLMDANGIKDELPPITTFLNRLLALTIDLQNVLFTAFEQLLTARIEGAIASGTYDVGLETLRAESFVVTDRRTIYTHPGTGAETRLLTITQRERNRPVTLDEALDRLSDPRAVLLINERSGRAAVQVPAPSLMLDDGEIERRVRLIRPMESHSLPLKMMAESHWVGSRSRTLRRRLAGRACRGARVHRQHDPHRRGLAPADLEAPAERVDARLSASDRCGRAHHRTQGLARLGRDRAGDGRTDADAETRLRRADGRSHRPRSRRGPAAPPRPRHGREPHRAVRLHRHDAGSAARPTASSTRSSPGSCACSCPPTRAASASWRRCSNAIRSSASANGRPRDAARRFRTGTPSRARGRGGVPPLSLQRHGARAATGWSATSATHRAARCSCGSTELAEGTRRQMDRRRHRRARRFARRHPRKPAAFSTSATSPTRRDAF